MYFPDSISQKELRKLREQAAFVEDVYICDACDVAFDSDLVTVTYDGVLLCRCCLAEVKDENDVPELG